MPKQVTRGNSVSYTIPDKVVDDFHYINPNDFKTIIDAIKMNLGEAKGFRRVISGYGDHTDRIKRYYKPERTADDDKFEIQNRSGSPLLVDLFNYILTNINRVLADLYGYEETIGNLKYKLYNQPGNYTFVTPKGCKSVIVGLCGGGSGIAKDFDGKDSSFDKLIARGGKGVFTRNALAFTSGYSVSLYEMINGYYGRPERSISWLNNNILEYNNIEYNSGKNGEFIHGILNVKENTGYAVTVGSASNPAKYADINKIPSNGFVYIAYIDGGDESSYGFDNVYITPGKYTYVVPGGVTKISVAVIGGGAIYLDMSRYKTSSKKLSIGANGQDSKFGDIVAKGGQYLDSKKEPILKDITESGWNLSFFRENGTLGRGFINNSYGTKVSDDGDMIIKTVDVFPGQEIPVIVGDGGTIEMDENGTKYTLTANHGAIGIMIGDHSEIKSFSQFKMMKDGDVITIGIMNNIIRNLEAISKVFDNNESFWDDEDLCTRSCQVSCQSSCQLACQDCQYFTSHNQNSGGWL